MRTLSIISLLTFFFLASCGEGDVSERDTEMENNTEVENNTETVSDMATTSQAGESQAESETPMGAAVMYSTSTTDGANEVTGYVIFTRTDEGVRVEATITGLELETDHGFHIHQYGDCRAPDASSAGGHYNPTNEEHGAPSDEERHVGDLGNISANAQGTAEVDFVDDVITLSGQNSIIGRGVIVHANEDDLTSQPSGDAGPRVACGVIGIANPDVTIDHYDGLREELKSEQ